ncbi:hypothetical protein [Priestia koreensis]|uniref:hypothetical protein n=1 Tax=Priestia koreensis TaxID=284581 RepID=UPI001F58C1BD|nr:hypothetical protein [Priestia koreensis]UNL86289.1 hypothetical protein IE339_07275 [Priestia koreensis]
MSFNEIGLLIFFGILDILLFVLAFTYKRKASNESGSFGSPDNSGAFYMNVLSMTPFFVQKLWRFLLAFGLLALIVFVELKGHHIL